MAMKTALDDIVIRTGPEPGDPGHILYMHGWYYEHAYRYGQRFESYVALGLHEFLKHHDPERDRVWMCEHQGRVMGSLLLMHRKANAAQLRYFLVLPEYQGIGLGKRLMVRFMDSLAELSYDSAFLWTTDELPAAASLYVRYGFVLTEETDSSDFGPPVRAQRYDLII
jgi:peptidyl-dipeptidase Dcp